MRDVELFETLPEAKLILAEHPHSALGMLPPATFAARWREQAALELAA